MEKSIVAFENELSRLRVGRANPSLLDHVMVDYYNNSTPLNQVASIKVEDVRTLSVTPWEKAMVAPIEKAIMTSGLGLNPVSAGMVIRVPLPALTEDRRREIVKLARDESEKTKVSVRHVRRELNHLIKERLKLKEMTEDEVRREELNIQKITDSYIAKVDSILSDKEKDIMSL